MLWAEGGPGAEMGEPTKRKRAHRLTLANVAKRTGVAKPTRPSHLASVPAGTPLTPDSGRLQP